MFIIFIGILSVANLGVALERMQICGEIRPEGLLDSQLFSHQNSNNFFQFIDNYFFFLLLNSVKFWSLNTRL